MNANIAVGWDRSGDLRITRKASWPLAQRGALILVNPPRVFAVTDTIACFMFIFIVWHLYHRFNCRKGWIVLIFSFSLVCRSLISLKLCLKIIINLGSNHSQLFIYYHRVPPNVTRDPAPPINCVQCLLGLMAFVPC